MHEANYTPDVYTPSHSPLSFQSETLCLCLLSLFRVLGLSEPDFCSLRRCQLSTGLNATLGKIGVKKYISYI